MATTQRHLGRRESRLSFLRSRDCARTEGQLAKLHQRAKWLEQEGISVDLREQNIAEQHPDLNPELYGVLQLPAGHVDPRRTMQLA